MLDVTDNARVARKPINFEVILYIKTKMDLCLRKHFLEKNMQYSTYMYLPSV